MLEGIINLLLFVVILGTTVFIHELGHFIFAKKAGIYCYEFSLGMGPRLFGFKRKNDETDYSIRLFPIGGYVKMAGEEIDEDEDIEPGRRLQNKTFSQRLITVVAGALFNFLLGIVLLFLIGVFYGSPETKPYIGSIDENYNAYKEGIRTGDLILKIDDKKVFSWDEVLLRFEIKEEGTPMTIEFMNVNNEVKSIVINPVKEIVDGEDKYIYLGNFTALEKTNYGFINAFKYSIEKFLDIYLTMYKIIYNLIVGKLGLDNLTGPIGIYKIVGEQAKMGFQNIIYLIAFLSINVGFINLLPFPAFDGGRALFMFIEKIRRKPVDARVENIIHTVGFVFLMALMLLVAVKDIGRIIG